MSGKRLSKTEKLELLRSGVLHLDSIDAEAVWIPVVTRFVERWNTLGEAPATVKDMEAGMPPMKFITFVTCFRLHGLLSTKCPQCKRDVQLHDLDRTESGALRCTSCRDKITTEKKEN